MPKMSEFYKGMRVVSTDKAVANGLFREPCMGTVFRTPRPGSARVAIIRDGHKCENMYHQSFWMPVPDAPEATAEETRDSVLRQEDLP